MPRAKGDQSMFWGIALMVIGAIVLLNVVFGVNLPIMRTLFGVLLIYWGLKIIFGFHWSANKFVSDDTVVFHSTKFEYRSDKNNREFNTVFGDSTVDLTTADHTDEPIKVEINAVFGQSEVLLPANSQITTRSNSVAGSVSLPENIEIDNSKPVYKFNLTLTSVFGSIIVKRANY